MEKSPSETISHSASQEISQLSRNPKVRYCDHKGLLLVPITDPHPEPDEYCP